MEPPEDFKNGVLVGNALHAIQVAPLCIMILSKIDENDRQKDPFEIYAGERAIAVNQLMHGAWLMHQVVELPDSVFPHKAPLRKRLTMTSDYLHENHAIIPDLKEYEAGREKHHEELQRLFSKREETGRLLRDNYDRHIETIKILADYRSTGKSKASDEAK